MLLIRHRKNVSCYESFKKASELDGSFGTELIAGIAGSNAAEGMDIRLLCLSSVV